MRESGGGYTCTHVFFFVIVRSRHVPLICHLDYGLLDCARLQYRFVDLDAMEGHVHSSTEAHLLQDAGHVRRGSGVQTEGLFPP